MTDSQLIFGILQNDEQVWRYIYKNMKFGFVSILRCDNAISGLCDKDIEDVFHKSLIVLMQKVKCDKVVCMRDGGLFSYLVQIGKFTANNLIKKKSSRYSGGVVTFEPELHDKDETGPMDDEEKSLITVGEKQQMQNEFIDKVLNMMPAECRMLLKHFYWNHKPMDEIASILGMRNADSAKSKKSKCMNKAKEIAAQLLENGEFAEEMIRNAVERAALRVLIEEERYNADSGFTMAALNIEDKEDDE